MGGVAREERELAHRALVERADLRLAHEVHRRMVAEDVVGVAHGLTEQVVKSVDRAELQRLPLVKHRSGRQ